MIIKPKPAEEYNPTESGIYVNDERTFFYLVIRGTVKLTGECTPDDVFEVREDGQFFKSGRLMYTATFLLPRFSDERESEVKP